MRNILPCAPCHLYMFFHDTSALVLCLFTKYIVFLLISFHGSLYTQYLSHASNMWFANVFFLAVICVFFPFSLENFVKQNILIVMRCNALTFPFTNHTSGAIKQFLPNSRCQRVLLCLLPKILKRKIAWEEHGQFFYIWSRNSGCSYISMTAVPTSSCFKHSHTHPVDDLITGLRGLLKPRGEAQGSD